MTSSSRRNLRNGLLFASPFMIGVSLFYIYPIAMSFYYSFTRYNFFSSPQWIGLDNYMTLWKDDLFRTSLYNTFYYTFFYVGLGVIIVALGEALLLNLKVKGLSIFRVIVYLPRLVPLVVTSTLWIWIFNPQYGAINLIFRYLGLRGPGWLVDPQWSKLSLVIISIWVIGQTVLIYIAALQGISVQLYEAAEIDGATWWHKLIYVTLPMVSPAILFNVVIGLIFAFQLFTLPYLVTGGGPANTTLFYSLYLYQNAFQYFKMGYACTQGWILFVIILTCTVIVFRSSARWVYYRG